MKWRYGIVKKDLGPDSDPEYILCEVYFDTDPLSVISYSENGAAFLTSEESDQQKNICKWLEKAIQDCKKYPVIDSANLFKNNNAS